MFKRTESVTHVAEFAYALTAAGVGFDIPHTDASYKDVIALIETAQFAGLEVVLRFKADGVNCGSKNEYRKDLIGITLRSSEGVVN